MLSRTFIVKNIPNSLTYTFASSCVCTSPLAGMTVVGLHDFVKVSISASLKSFLLIMCIDAPESTTNSRSSGLIVDAGRHLISEGEKSVALSCSFNFNTLLAVQSWFHQVAPNLSSTEVDTCTGEVSLLIPSSRSSNLNFTYWQVKKMRLRKMMKNDSPVLKVSLRVDDDPEDELDKPGTTMRRKFSVLQSIRIPF